MTNHDWITVKPIYSAPIVEQLKDLKRACQMALDLMDTMPLKNITAADLRREHLREGEFALCDWIVRPRFTIQEPTCCGDAITYPVTFEDWWKMIEYCKDGPEPIATIGGSKFGSTMFHVTKSQARAIWESIGLQ